jgi:hypothetical protein
MNSSVFRPFAQPDWLQRPWQGVRRWLGVPAWRRKLHRAVPPLIGLVRRAHRPRALPPIDEPLLMQMRSELSGALNRHPLTRTVAPALALVERALRQPHGAGLHRLPMAALQDAIVHLDVLADSARHDALHRLGIHLQRVQAQQAHQWLGRSEASGASGARGEERRG